jgi:hypothetical protein
MKKVIFLLLLTAIPALPGFCAENQVGLGYGKEFRGNTDLEQIELFWRHQLSYNKNFDNGAQLLTFLEAGGAALHERDSDTNDEVTMRFSLMPQLALQPDPKFRFIAGLGAGFMAGETEFDDHNLGGAFFLDSKLGMQWFFTENFSVEYDFFHQSNAGMYDYNASLNMHYLCLAYRF